ncbi:hypothetical protein HU200_008295 [Digitaria exilis]|uniref:Uncharacterized protein n=1 Tax=Digitaria exilis TaxID=1010633 RepID=A0A835FPB6_9POAL|nr:hypothetical protein HU200_008295 [Digitaria exilis]
MVDGLQANRRVRRRGCYDEEAAAAGRTSACGLQSAEKKSFRSRRDRTPGSSLPLALGLGSSEQSPPGHTQHHAAAGAVFGPSSSAPAAASTSAAALSHRLDLLPVLLSPPRIALATASRLPCFLRLPCFPPPRCSSPPSSPLPDEEEDADAAAPGEEARLGFLRRRSAFPSSPPPPAPLGRLSPPAYMQPPRTVGAAATDDRSRASPRSIDRSTNRPID